VGPSYELDVLVNWGWIPVIILILIGLAMAQNFYDDPNP